ncbi:MAG TPA: helix-turn-helix transcriptional regulator [Pedobacter sp.]
MRKYIPVLDSCSLSDYKDDMILIDHFGHYLHKHSNLLFPHRHNFYHLVLFTNGGGYHSIDFNRFEVKPWHMYFMSPGQVHSWNFEGGTEGYVINFSREFFQSFLLRPDFLDSFSFFRGIARESTIELNPGIREDVLSLFEKLVLNLNSGGTISWDIIRVMLLYLFMLTDQNGSVKEREKMHVYNYTILYNFQQLIEKHYARLRLPKEYADLLYITPGHLNALCKEHLGQQAGEVIRNRILLESKRLLVSRDLSISEIAYELNFNDNSYFSKFFRKLSGITPEEFRRINM